MFVEVFVFLEINNINQNRGQKMKSKTDIRFESRARIIKAIVYAKRIFIVIEMRNGEKHLISFIP